MNNFSWRVKICLRLRTNKKKNWRRHAGFNGQNTSTNSRGRWLVNTTARFDAPIKSVKKIICYDGTLKKKVYRVLYIEIIVATNVGRNRERNARE